MMSEHQSPLGNSPLGNTVDYDAAYDPALLYPIARADGRRQLALSEPLPFRGWDIWNAYELSWVDRAGKPRVAIGEFWVPADSPHIIESKSLKLYLNSLNQQRVDSPEQLRDILVRDLTDCLGVEPEVHLHLPSNWSSPATDFDVGRCLDDLPVTIEHYEPAPHLLRTRSAKVVEQRVFSRLLRSRCPVTGQPDWATVYIEYCGEEIDEAGLLAYIVSFRQHQDFHEQCIERMFVDILRRCTPQQLSVYGRYLRRGGLDINPFRSTGGGRPANLRDMRQ